MNEHDGLLLTKSGILPLTGKITGNTVQTITKKTTLPLQKHFACRGRKGKKFVWTDVRKNVRRYVSREVLDVLFLVLRPRAQHDRGFGDTFSTSTTAKSMQIDVIANRTTCPGSPPNARSPWTSAKKQTIEANRSPRNLGKPTDCAQLCSAVGRAQLSFSTGPGRDFCKVAFRATGTRASDRSFFPD